MDKLLIMIIIGGVIAAELLVLIIGVFMCMKNIKLCAQNTDDQRNAILKMVAMNVKGVSNEQHSEMNGLENGNNNPFQNNGLNGQMSSPFMNEKSERPNPFGNQQAPQATPFGNQQAPQVTPFGNQQAPQATPFGNQMPQQAPTEQSEKPEASAPVGFEPEATIMISRTAAMNAAMQKPAEESKEAEQKTTPVNASTGADGTIICSKCYNPLPAYGKFCPNCSSAIEGR